MRSILRNIAMVGVLGGVMITAVGCGGHEKAIVTVEYTLEPSKGLPPGLNQIAVAPAELGPATDAKWSDMTADMLTQLIERSRDLYGTQLRVADRSETKKVFDENDLSAAGLTAGGGGQPAQLLGVQAYLVSKINIKEEVAHGKATTISGLDFAAFGGHGWGGGGGGVDTREVEKVKKNVTAQALFKLVDAKTGEAWAIHEDTVRSTEETKPSPLFGSGEGESGLTPTDAIAGTLIERVAREFVAELVPCQVSYELEVKSSSNESCVQGVKLLRADMYEDALDQFKQAIAEDPEDDRAIYAAGVACEALGNFDEALGYYRRAYAAEAEPEYGAAKKRLDDDLPHIRKT
jgi:tetratricopeptide (TPR) repeat protein